MNDDPNKELLAYTIYTVDKYDEYTDTPLAHVYWTDENETAQRLICAECGEDWCGEPFTDEDKVTPKEIAEEAPCPHCGWSSKEDQEATEAWWDMYNEIKYGRL